MEEKHGLYYLEMVKEQAEDLRTQKAKEIREALEKELPNIRAAWDWMLREKRVEEIGHYIQALRVFLDSHNNYGGAAMFKQTAVVLDEDNPKHHTALGYALIYQAWLEHRLDYKANSIIEVTQRGLALLEPLNEYPGILRGRMTLAVVAIDQGDFVKAKEIFTAALNLARAYGKPSDIARNLMWLSATELELNFSDARDLMPTRLEELREIGDILCLSAGLDTFGSYLVDNNQLDEGEKLLQESLELARTSNYYVFQVLGHLARLAYKRRDFSKSDTLSREAFEIASKQGFASAKAVILALWGRVKLAQGQLGEAEQLMIRSLEIGWDATMLLAVSHSLLSLAELSIAKGQVKQGVSLLSFLSRYQVIEKADRDETLKLLEKAKEHLSPRDLTEAQKASKSLTLEGIVAGILEWL